jgi:hypothetical protein
MAPYRKKLIEAALPPGATDESAAGENLARHGHPAADPPEFTWTE